MMETTSIVTRHTFSAAASASQTLRSYFAASEIGGLEDILIYGVQYQLRVLQADRPAVSPWVGVTLSRNLNESNFWSGSDDLKLPGLFHADSYDTLPAKDYMLFPGGPLEFRSNEQIHQTITVENLDPNAAFDKTVRWQLVFFWDWKEKVRRETQEVWRELQRL